MATTTPNYGWSVPTSSDYVAQGAVAIETLGDSVDATLFTALGGAYPGMRLIKKQTVGTGVSSVVITDAFSASYENYKILYNNGVGSTSTAEIRLSLNGSTGSTYYESLLYQQYGAAGAAASATSNGALFWTWSGNASTVGTQMDVTLKSPFLAKPTSYSSIWSNLVAGGTAGTDSGFQSQATSFTGFTLTPNPGTLTGGTIYVYGYGAS
jgi:hypothetical protein